MTGVEGVERVRRLLKARALCLLEEEEEVSMPLVLAAAAVAR